MYQISSKSPKFCRGYNEKHFGIFFPDTVYASALLGFALQKHRFFVARLGNTLPAHDSDA